MYDKIQPVLVINMVSRIMLEIRKDRAERHPKDKELAKEICDIVNLPFKEEKFDRMATRPINGENHGSCIDIFFEGYDFCVMIYDEVYSIGCSYFNKEYASEKEYEYFNESPYSKAVKVSHGDYGIELINETNSNLISLYSNEASFTRSHGDYSIVKGITPIRLKKYSDEIKYSDYYQYQEVFYDNNPKNIHHFSRINKAGEYQLTTTAALNESYYETLIDNSQIDAFEEFIIEHSGSMLTTQKGANICFDYSDIQDANKSNSCLIRKIYVLDERRYYLLIETANNNRPTVLMCENVSNITINDLEHLSIFVSERLTNEPYVNIFIDYLNDLIFRLKMRQRSTIDSLVTYNGDALDYYIIEGKDTFSKGKPIEQRGFELYMNKEAIPEMVEKIDLRKREKPTTFHQ